MKKLVQAELVIKNNNETKQFLDFYKAFKGEIQIKLVGDVIK